jgi:sulfur carrier protein ThiS
MHEPTNDAAPGWSAGDDVATYCVNGREQLWRTGLTLAEVVSDEAACMAAAARIGAAATGACDVARPAAAPPVATSVNGRFVARARRASIRIAPGDQVLLFQPIVGG